MQLQSSQYERVLELMLELERKMEKAMMETRRETNKTIMETLDVASFRRDIDTYIEDKLALVEQKFENIYGEKILEVEQTQNNMNRTIK